MIAEAIVDHFVQATRMLVVLLVFRAGPFVTWALCSKRMGVVCRLAHVVIYAPIVFLVHKGSLLALVATVGGYAYYVLLGLSVYWLAANPNRFEVTKPALFLLCASAYLVIPAAVLPGLSGVAFLVVGWDMMFSSYSYLMEAAKQKRPPTLSECLFFLLVNPTLVFVERGQRVGEPSLHKRALLRIGASLLIIFIHFALLSPASQLVRNLPPGAFVQLTGMQQLVAFGLSSFVAFYAAHSGLASFQIGWMRLLGYRIPERYHYPFLAKSPLDFWRRWNIYVGSWVNRYVFFPAAVHRFWRFLRSYRSWGRVPAVFVAFATVGILHDGYHFLSKLEFSTDVTQGFAVQGVLVILWIGAGRWFASRALSQSLWVRRLASSCSRVFFAITVFASLGVWN